MRILDILFGSDQSDEPGEYTNRTGRGTNQAAFGGDQEKQDSFREGFRGDDRRPRGKGRTDQELWEYPDSKGGDGPQVRFKEATYGGIPMRGANGEEVKVQVQRWNDRRNKWDNVRDPQEAYSLFEQLKKNSNSSGSRQEPRRVGRGGDGLWDYNR